MNGTVVGDYRVLDLLGAGGMGEVYRAVHARTGRVVALKMLSRAAVDPVQIERFWNEARIHATLRHPNIAALHECFEFEGRPCLVMEYVDGQTLAERIKGQGALSADEAVAVFRPIVQAIDYVHEQGVVHRDIKASNVKITSGGAVKLLDFGIARGASTPGLTCVGNVVGTLEYLSPEQLKSGAADERSDIWALGVLLHEMLAGRVPFAAPTVGALYEQISKTNYRRASTENLQLPRPLDLIIARCLRKNPADRYPSARELLRDVDQPGAAQAALPARFMGPPARRWSSAGAALLLMLGLGAAWRGGQNSEVQSPDIPNVPAEPARQLSLGESGKWQTIRVQMQGQPAQVYRDGRLLQNTPYEFQARLGEQVELVLKRRGFKDKRLPITVTVGKRLYTETLEPEKDPHDGDWW